MAKKRGTPGRRRCKAHSSGPLARVGWTMDPEVAERIESLARKNGRSTSAEAELAIRQWLDHRSEFPHT